MPRGLNPYDEAVVQRRLWTPAQWRTAVWFDAADLSTVTTIGNGVTEWRDKSGFQRHVTVPATVNAPTLQQNIQNGLTAIDWGAATNNLGLRNLAVSNFNPTRYLIVAHYEGPNPFNEYAGLVSHNGAALTELIITSNNGTLWIAGSFFHNGATSATQTALPTIRQPFVLTSNFAQSANRTSLFIGNDRFFTGFTRGWRGKIFEVVGIDFVWSDAERARAEGYAAWKWGLVANLPATHPFRNDPPVIGD
jgi:hypothetical protein